MLHVPYLQPGRKCSGGASEAGGPGGWGLWRDVPALSGDTQRDCVLLSRVHPTPVRGTRRDYARTHSAGPLWALLGIGGGVAGCRIDHGLDPAGVSDAGPAVPGYSTAEVQRRELCDFVDLRAQSAHRGGAAPGALRRCGLARPVCTPRRCSAGSSATLWTCAPSLHTAEVQRRELCDFVDLRAQSAHRGLPPPIRDVRGYAAYALEARPFRLDSSLIRTHTAGCTAWHAELRDLYCGLYSLAC
ncbi:hypothetical protein CYMTET_32395 [Cymbomonas tetramitiformis]|uniref:Uncharacterized protein n=1 Tax=Cymbomonas tetramitiformis TaxID=36881 RepID=A0AAE0FFE1_9CHLO|nr:hypothetical protein CYMTET_32395 [Cymbomonas tetramitiformis]